MQEEITVNGVRIRIEGQAAQHGSRSNTPTIMMIHGWPDTLRLWEGQVAALAPTYRCVRFTLPGYDVDEPRRRVSLDEMVQLFSDIVDAVSPTQPVTLLLHDWGCVFGYQFAARHPARVARVIGVDVGDTFDPRFAKQLSLKAKAMVLTYQLWLAAAYPLGRVGTKMTQGMARLLKAPAPPAELGAQQNYPYVMQWSGGFRSSVQFVPHCPMLYIYGERKPFMFHSPNWLRTVAATERGKVAGFPTGHWVMTEANSAFNATILDWLDATSRS